MTNFMIIPGTISKLLPTDYVGFTFFIGCMAMMAASAFFFLSLNQFDKKWRFSLIVKKSAVATFAQVASRLGDNAAMLSWS